MKIKQWIGLCIIVLGISIFSYYFIEWYTARKSAESLTFNEIKKYQATTPIKEINRNIINKTRTSSTEQRPIQIPASEVSHQAGEKVAYLIIPKIEKKYSVYWGADDEILKKGVGMFVSELTTTPSGNGHTVLSGHRDTVFTELNQLQKDDQLILEYENKTYTYKVEKYWITDSEDRTIIVQKENSILSLTTCYPFNYIGDAPDRYIIEASLVSTS
ncbi:class D sortase [Bacillus thuringiensis]|uniref:Class D sortase n=1 Tax=Bacillus thuringiensis subsp. higo TaxID=132266 RepID=A0A9X6QWP1_BACUH|nr:class D sortase [Bacillus thuringiensis]OUB41450.1 class D sortase [Bacillus thuringiensis serovar higo]OUB61214.1 class D sortase [Bacillus thuringiensis serovar higo]